jgi:hypothetical protein
MLYNIIITTIFLGFLSCCHENTHQQILRYEQKNDHALIANNNHPTKLLKDLFKKIECEPSEDTLAAYNEMAQKKFFRSGERWQIKPKYEQYGEAVARVLEKAGWKDNILPLKQEYDYGVFLGSTVQRMEERMEYFVKLIKNNKISIKEIIFHVSDRPLDPTVEPVSLWRNVREKPQTEHEAAVVLWKKVCKRHKVSLPIEVINHPMIIGENGKLGRPHTGHVMDLWMKKNPKQGSILAISNQPYCQYQKAVLVAHLLKNKTWRRPFSIEVVGPANSNEHNQLTALHLDNMARYIYSSKMAIDLAKE